MFTVRRWRNRLRYASCLLLENSHPWMFPQRSADSHELTACHSSLFNYPREYRYPPTQASFYRTVALVN